MTSSPRIGYILLEWPRYSETFILNEMLALTRHGMPAHVFCLRGTPGEDPAVATPLAGRAEAVGSLDGDVTLCLSSVAWAMESSPDAVEQAAASARTRMRSRLEETNTIRRREPLFALACALHIAWRCRELQISHLHCHYAGLPADVGNLVRRLMKISYSFTGHAKDIFTMDRDRLRRRIESAAFAVTCSETGRSTMAAAAPEFTDKIHRIYHGIETGNWAIDRHPASSPSRIVAVGRLTPKKGFSILVEALALLRTNSRDVHVTIIGEGRERQNLQALAEDLNVSDRLHLAGRLDQKQIRDAFSTATAFVLPSVILETNNQDGVANAMLEAMASGVPVVVSDIPALKEILEPEKTALLFPQGNPSALAGSLERLLNDPALAERIGAAGQGRVAEFDLSDAARNLAELFNAHA